MFKRDDQHHNGGSERLSRRAFLGRTMLQAAAIGGLAAGTTRLGWWRPSSGLSASGGIGGLVSDLLTGEPIAGATIAVTGSATALATTDRYGRYWVPLPTGVYEVHAAAKGYLGMARDGLFIAEGTALRADLAMIIENPSQDQQDALYDKSVRVSEWPPVGSSMVVASSSLAGASATVPDTIVVRWADLSRTTMILDDYLRHVVAGEMGHGWPPQALRAQAVASRSYAVAYYNAYGYICADTACQYYGPYTYDDTNQAVWDTHGVVAIYAYTGAIIWANFFAQCNGVTTRNSERPFLNTGYGGTCTVGSWNVSPYLRERSCTGHAWYAYSSCHYHGHGVGMCQWGARDLANAGLSFDQIVKRYYTDIQLIGMDTPPELATPADGAVLKSGVPVQLRWTGNSATYGVTIVNSYGNTVWNTSVSTLSVTSPALPAGNYAWYVTGSTGGAAPVFSVTWNFRLVDMPYNQVLPARKRS